MSPHDPRSKTGETFIQAMHVGLINHIYNIRSESLTQALKRKKDQKFWLADNFVSWLWKMSWISTHWADKWSTDLNEKKSDVPLWKVAHKLNYWTVSVRHSMEQALAVNVMFRVKYEIIFQEDIFGFHLWPHFFLPLSLTLLCLITFRKLVKIEHATYWTSYPRRISMHLNTLFKP